MRKTVNIWWVIAFVACCLFAFFAYSNKLSAEIDALQKTLDHEKAKLTEMQEENAELDAKLQIAGTDAFVENQARDLYDFMMPDEIRFVISNPQAQNQNTAEVSAP